ncbi:MAG: fibronectin type III domain-containing protein [Chloroflexota bacterium]
MTTINTKMRTMTRILIITGICVLWATVPNTSLFTGAINIATAQSEPEQSNFDCSRVSEIPQIECEALVAIYNKNGGLDWRDNTGWLETRTPCSWVRVTCDNNHVSELDFSGDTTLGSFGKFGVTGSLAAEIGNLSKLRRLELWYNEVNSIPSEIGNLSNLWSLRVSFNNLSNIPPSIGNLSNLGDLQLRYNEIRQIPPEIGNLSRLYWLYLSGNKLDDLPDEITQLSNLTNLSIRGNRFQEFPSEILELSNLVELYIGDNHISSIPPKLDHLSNLEKIGLNQNQFTSIPRELGNLSKLKSLWLDRNELTSIPSEIGNLSSLEWLELHDNQLMSIPPEIGDLSNLYWFELQNNQLTSIPPEIGNLYNLEKFYLNGNKLYSLPLELDNLVYLDRFHLRYNALTITNTNLLDFVNEKSDNWMDTQTVAPNGLSAEVLSSDRIKLTWTPIIFQEEGGYYEVSVATDNNFTVRGTTADKTNDSYILTGLSPNTTYTIRIRTYTPAHDSQSNELWSRYSQVVSITTTESTPTPSATPTTATNTPTITPTPGITPTSIPTLPPSGHPEDAYENDNQCDIASPIGTNGIYQTHTFHNASDEDWIRINAVQGMTYRIDVDIPAGSRADVDMSLHAECDTLPDSLWNEPFAPGGRLEFTSPFTGPVYVRVSNVDASVSGGDVVYRIKVRSIDDGQETGAAIIVAGRLRATDLLQDNIHHASETFYKALQANGYVRDDIFYMATDSTLVGYDAPATLANLRLAITDWARERVNSERALTLYMIDHGARDQFIVDGVRGDRLTPTQLDGWLDELQDEIDGLKINVILEMCNSGSFIDNSVDGFDSISGENRTILTSTNVDDLAFASRNGAHFSDHFISHIRQGHDVYSSFEHAREQISLINDFQHPWLDADGDSIPNESDDFTLAAERGFGFPGTFMDFWPPYIVDAEENTTGLRTTTNNFTRIIEAEVRDNHRVDDVWAVIYPPSYQPPTSSEELVQQPEQVVLLQPVGNDRYAVTYPGFTETGTYKIHIHAVDEDGLAAAPVVMEIQNGFENRVYLPVITR